MLKYNITPNFDISERKFISVISAFEWVCDVFELGMVEKISLDKCEWTIVTPLTICE